MKPKQIIENIKKLKTKRKSIIAELSLIDEADYSQALDHAINCVGAIEQIKWERDIAIQQLNELGYQFGEKIRSDE